MLTFLSLIAQAFIEVDGLKSGIYPSKMRAGGASKAS